MTPNLSQITNTEMKRYLSDCRNNEEAFRAGLEVLMSRRNPANLQPYPFDLTDPQGEVEAILRERFNQSE
jgi:hypothetical protein